MLDKAITILLAQGFEEAQAIIVINILRCLEITVEKLACQEGLELLSYHAIRIFADALLSNRANELYDAVVIPGGPEGTVNLAANPQMAEFIRRHDASGKLVYPLCSAAAQVLGGNGLLNSRRYVCSGDLYQQVADGIYVNQKVVEDSNLLSERIGRRFRLRVLPGIAPKRRRQANFQMEHIYYDHWHSASDPG